MCKYMHILAIVQTILRILGNLLPEFCVVKKYEV